MNPYRFFQHVMEAWPAWFILIIVWIIAFAATGSPAKAAGITLAILAGIFAAAALGIGWGLAESWLTMRADELDERRRAGVTSNVTRPPNDRS